MCVLGLHTPRFIRIQQAQPWFESGAPRKMRKALRGRGKEAGLAQCLPPSLSLPFPPPSLA